MHRDNGNLLPTPEMSVYACLAKHALHEMPLSGGGATPMEILCYTEGIRGTGVFDRLVSKVAGEVGSGPKAQSALDKFRKTAVFKGTPEYSKRANQLGDQMKKSPIFKRSQAINNKCRNSKHKTWIYAVDMTLCNSGTRPSTEPPTREPANIEDEIEQQLEASVSARGPLHVGAISKSRPTTPTTNGAPSVAGCDDIELLWSDFVAPQPSVPKSAGGGARRERWPYLPEETEETEYEKERAANIKQNQDKLHELLHLAEGKQHDTNDGPALDTNDGQAFDTTPEISTYTDDEINAMLKPIIDDYNIMDFDAEFN